MAVLIRPDAVARLEQAKRAARIQWLRDTKLVRYYKGQQGVPYTPESATAEYRQLQRRSITNVVRLVADVMVAGLHIDGLVPSDLLTDAVVAGAELAQADELAEARELEGQVERAAGWRYWQAAGLDAGQTIATRRAVVLGYNNLATWVSDHELVPDPKGGEELVEVRYPEPVVEVRSCNPLNSWGRYDDVDDVHPREFIRRLGGKTGLAQGASRWEVWAEDYRAIVDETGRNVVEEWSHELDHVPVTRLVGSRDLEGNPEGKVEPLREAQDRLNETVFTLLMAQTYQAFRQRWAVGVDSLEGVNPGVDRIIHTKGDKSGAAFGEFAAADLGMIVKAVESALSTVAALGQIPPQNVLGLPSNVGPEGLEAAERGHTRQRAEWQRNLGEGWEAAIRDVGALAGDDNVAEDQAAQVHWASTESRSFAQVVDGLVKLTSGERPILPVEVAIELVPGLTQTDRRRALRLLREAEPTGLEAAAGSAAAGLFPNLAAVGAGGPLN